MDKETGTTRDTSPRVVARTATDMVDDQAAAINEVRRAPGIPGRLQVVSTYVGNGQLVYVFVPLTPGSGCRWYEYNYTNGTWHLYKLV